MGISLSNTGEVADFTQADQFQPSKSQFECGYFAGAVCKAMAQVGKPPSQSVAQIIAEAEAWYAQYDGSDAITNTDGMTLPQLYELLAQVSLHYQSTATDVATVRAWLAVGYPVIIAITESSVHDLALGDVNPYPWATAGTHIIVATGLAPASNILVRDTANCTNLYDPNSLRPGPRTYDAAKLQLVSATVCVPPWLPRPASATPPTTAPQPVEGEPMPLDISQASAYFEAIDDSHWRRKDRPDVVLSEGLLGYYRSFGSAVFGILGLPDESDHPVLDSTGKTIPNTAMARCERAVICWDPDHQLDFSGETSVGHYYNMHIDGNGPGADPRIAQLEAQLVAAQKAAGSGSASLGNTCIDAVRQVKSIVDAITA